MIVSILMLAALPLFRRASPGYTITGEPRNETGGDPWTRGKTT